LKGNKDEVKPFSLISAPGILLFSSHQNKIHRGMVLPREDRYLLNWQAWYLRLDYNLSEQTIFRSTAISSASGVGPDNSRCSKSIRSVDSPVKPSFSRTKYSEKGERVL